MQRAIFPLTADPFTYGHLNIIEKAFRLCDKELIVALLQNTNKKQFFSVQKRKQLVEEAIASYSPLKRFWQETKSLAKPALKKIRVLYFDGLLSDLILREDIFSIIRGIRKNEDLIYEKLLEKGWREQLTNIDEKLNIIYLISDENKRGISSSIARSIAQHHGDLSSYVPPNIKQAIDKKLFNQQKIIITGSIATGKTSVAQKLKELFNRKEREAYVVRFDDIVNEIYKSMNAGYFGMLREKILQHFGPQVLDANEISKKKISKQTFNQPLADIRKDLLFLEKNFSPYILKAYRRELLGKSGTFFLDASQAAEYNMLYESVGLVVCVENNEELQRQYFRNRNIAIGKEMNDAEMEKRIKAALPQQEKRILIEKKLKALGCGKLFIYKNVDANYSLLQSLADELEQILFNKVR